MKNLLVLSTGLLVAFALSSCSPPQANYSPRAARPVSSSNYLQGLSQPGSVAVSQTRRNYQGYWDGDGISGTPKIIIDRGEQQAYFYKGDKLVSIAPVSTGKEGYDTPPGTFKVTQRSPNHRSNLYGVHKLKSTGEIINDDVDTRKDKVPPGAYYEGASMANFLRFNGGIGMHAGHLPGYAASHGCIRLPKYISKKFYDNAPTGTTVVVR